MEASNNEVTVKQRVLSRLVTARTQKKWVSRKDLLKIASRGYLDKLIPKFLFEGLIERKGSRGKYSYRATQLATKLLEGGRLPRSPLTRIQRPSERPRGHIVQLRPTSEFLDVESMWMEHQTVYIRLDQYTSKVLRAYCNPPSKKDKAQQMSYSCASFTITVSKHGQTTLIMKEPKWQESLVKWLLSCGLSQGGTNSTLSQIKAQLPESVKRIEMPCLDATLKKREVAFAVTTKIGDSKIVSNINYSTNTDFEVYGQNWLVDQWLAVLGGTQHNMVVVLSAMQEQIAKQAEQLNELQKEREAADQEKQSKKKEGADYYV